MTAGEAWAALDAYRARLDREAEEDSQTTDQKDARP